LAKKPIPKNDKTPKKKVNPFENPTGDLVIAKIPSGKPSHVLVLNKFPIIPNHFILATKDFKEQTDALEPIDLEATLACLKAYDSEGKKLFAFFNSGPHSGASQPHRHIQFLPVEDMAKDDIAGEWDLLMGSKSNLKSMPLLFFQEDIPTTSSTADLHEIYARLLKSCREAWDVYGEDAKVQASEFSYNMGMQTSSIVLCPRIKEGVTLHRDDESEIGYVALNGTMMGGTLMVKRAEEWDYLQNTANAIDRVLEALGLPVHSE
jgi:ATP adenylyltransferase